jgi:hypothetical protein
VNFSINPVLVTVEQLKSHEFNAHSSSSSWAWHNNGATLWQFIWRPSLYMFRFLSTHHVHYPKDNTDEEWAKASFHRDFGRERIRYTQNSYVYYIFSSIEKRELTDVKNTVFAIVLDQANDERQYYKIYFAFTPSRMIGLLGLYATINRYVMYDVRFDDGSITREELDKQYVYNVKRF